MSQINPAAAIISRPRVVASNVRPIRLPQRGQVLLGSVTPDLKRKSR
jgi:hypothetical protein